MASDTDIELLIGFENEARGYLPLILYGINDFFQGNRLSARFDAALRYSHTIKGAAAMLELTGLSQMARRLNVALQSLRAQGDPSQILFKEIMQRHVMIMEAYLDTLMDKINRGVSPTTIDNAAFVAAVEMLYRPDPGKVTPDEKRALDMTRNLSTGPLTELADVFQQEAEEHLQNISLQMGRLEKNPADEYALLEIRRSVHTLKGASASMGLRAIASLTHSLEDLFDSIVAEKRPLTQEITQLLQDSTDVINVLIEGESDGLDDDTATAMCASLIKRYELQLNTGAEAATSSTPTNDWDFNQAASPAPSIWDDPKANKGRATRKTGTKPLGNPTGILATSATGRDSSSDNNPAAENDAAIDAQSGDAASQADSAPESKRPEVKKPISTGDLPTRPIADPVRELIDAEMAAEHLPPEIAFADLSELEAAYSASLQNESAKLAIEESEKEVAFEENIEAILPSPEAPADEVTIVQEKVPPEIDPFPAYEAPTPFNSPITISPTFAPDSLNLKDSKTDDKGPGGVEEPGQTVVRVPIDRLDDLVRLMSEFIVSRSSLEQRFGQLSRLAAELKPSIERLNRLTGRMDNEFEAQTLLNTGVTQEHMDGMQQFDENRVAFDSLELDRYTEFHLLSREFAETSSDIRTVSYELETLLGQFKAIVEEQERLTSHLQEGLLNTRLVPFSALTNRLRRVIRTISRKQTKDIRFTITGDHIQVDKGVLAQLTDPLLHLLRNAVDHGIENVEEREAAGKVVPASIRIDVYQEGSQVIIDVQDDGRGLDLDVIRQSAVKKGLCDAAVAAELSREELYNLIFMPDFTTRLSVTEVSGRGVGLDIVKTNINRLQGTIAVASAAGEGSHFIIRLPMTLAVMRAMMVMAHNERYAIPLAEVSRVVQVSKQDIRQHNGQRVVSVSGHTYPAFMLGEALGVPAPQERSTNTLPALLINRNGRERIIVVDKLLQEQEIVVKSLGDHLRHVRSIAGATLLGDGQIVLIINTAELDTNTAPVKPVASELIAAKQENKPLQVMIVDDSVSVRRINERVVTNAGWQPIIARDGLEALELIQSGSCQPDIILLDIEMPRMDGYELTSTLRSMAAFRELPIILITSRAGQKHRHKAAEVGATAYLLKPYEEDILRSIIQKLTDQVHRVQAT